MQAYATTHDIPAVVTRCSNNYGPYQFPEKLIPLFVTNALDGQPLPLYGDGLNVRDWIHVEDHCAALWHVLGLPAADGDVFNVSAQNEVPNRTITDTILALTGRDETLVRYVADRPGHDRRYALDSSKLRATGWVPAAFLRQGLEATVEWYRAHRPWWEAVKSGAYRDYYERMYGARLAGGQAPSAQRRDPWAGRRSSPASPGRTARISPSCCSRRATGSSAWCAARAPRTSSASSTSATGSSCGRPICSTSSR